MAEPTAKSVDPISRQKEAGGKQRRHTPGGYAHAGEGILDQEPVDPERAAAGVLDQHKGTQHQRHGGGPGGAPQVELHQQQDQPIGDQAGAGIGAEPGPGVTQAAGGGGLEQQAGEHCHSEHDQQSGQDDGKSLEPRHSGQRGQLGHRGGGTSVGGKRGGNGMSAWGAAALCVAPLPALHAGLAAELQAGVFP